MSAEDAVRDLLEKKSITVPSSSLKGTVKVLDRSSIENALRGAGAGLDVSLVEPYLDFDTSEGAGTLDECLEGLDQIEAVLDQFQGTDEHLQLMTRVAEMRADHSVMKEEMTKASAVIKELSDSIRAGEADLLRMIALVAAVTTANGKGSEAQLLLKAIDFIRNSLKFE